MEQINTINDTTTAKKRKKEWGSKEGEKVWGERGPFPFVNTYEVLRYSCQTLNNKYHGLLEK